jgi:hypothetical protein
MTACAEIEQEVSITHYGKYASGESRLSVNWGYKAVLRSRSSVTAVICIYTPQEGFVLAADGLRIRAADKEFVEEEHAQKVFKLASKSGVLAYGCVGSTFPADNGKTDFRFYEEVKRAASHLPQKLSFENYIMGILYGIHQALMTKASVSLTHLINSFDDGACLFSVLFAGYFDTRPMRATIEIVRQGQEFVPCLVDLQQAPPNFWIHSGSDVVTEIFKPRLKEPHTIKEAMILARDYIQLCKDRRGTDPTCETIGGHIHIAKVTPDKGFGWMIRPKRPKARSGRKTRP